ncbi:MAG: DUF433 domain-containing protein [Anaerolineae bacterium]|nr:DUF433 domain-containing protein [Anaerolineae bacterium]
MAGTRIGPEQIVDAYEAGPTPEEIALRYRTLSLEAVYAAITYYLANQEQVKAYMQSLQREDEAEWKHLGHESLTKLLRERLETQSHTVIDREQVTPTL